MDTQLIQEAQTFFDVNRTMEQFRAQLRFASVMVLVMVTGPDEGLMYSCDWKAGLWQHVREIQVPMHFLKRTGYASWSKCRRTCHFELLCCHSALCIQSEIQNLERTINPEHALDWRNAKMALSQRETKGLHI